MLSGMLLHMLATPIGVDFTPHRSTDYWELGFGLEIVQNSAIGRVGNFGNSQAAGAFQGEPSCVVNLTAAGRVEGGFAEDACRPRLFRRGRNYGFDCRIKLVQVRGVVVKPFRHNRKVLV